MGGIIHNQQICGKSKHIFACKAHFGTSLQELIGRFHREENPMKRWSLDNIPGSSKLSSGGQKAAFAFGCLALPAIQCYILLHGYGELCCESAQTLLVGC